MLRRAMDRARHVVDRLRAMPTSGQIEEERRLLHRIAADQRRQAEHQQLLAGRILAGQVDALGVLPNLRQAEFQVFSQWGDDGIIHYLTSRIDPDNKTFVEFGVGDYMESNTRLLLMAKNWRGLVMDGSPENVARIRSWDQFWRFDLEARTAFIDRENINGLLADRGFSRDVGLLHIDVDGNDYWIWESIEALAPVIVILEYNAVFGVDRRITIPYEPTFQRTAAHSSNLYFGASLPALHSLSEKRGYAFLGCNSNGNNAYFARRDHLRNGVIEVDLRTGFAESRFRESRAPDGGLTYLSGEVRAQAIRGMPVLNLDTMSLEPF